MIPTVVVVLTVLSSTLTHPITTQDSVTSNTEGVPQVQEGISLNKQAHKTSAQGSFDVHAQVTEAEKSTLHSGTSRECTKVNNAQQVTHAEKTGAEISSDVYVSPQNAAVPNVENVPVNLQLAQTSYTENPVFLPIQSLSVVPANQADQVLQPKVIPVETIPTERMVIMAFDSFQQKNFQQDVSSVPESQISYQQVVQPVTYAQVPTEGVEPNQQPNYVAPFEKPDHYYSPVRIQLNLNPLVREQSLPQTAQQFVVPVPNYNQTPVEASAHVYSAQQNEQPVIREDSKKQAPPGYSSVQTKIVEPSVQQQQQQYQVQQSVEKQGPYQQSSLQSQADFVKPVGYENVEKQVQNQQYNQVQTQNIEQNYQQQQDYNTQQAVKKQVPNKQVNSYTPVENQAVTQSVYNVQPTVVEKTEKIGQNQASYSPVQIQSVEHQQLPQSSQQVVEKQVPHQQSAVVQTYPVEPANQQQVSSVQPLTVGQVENQIQYQKGTNFQNVGSFLEKAPENPEFKPNQQVFKVQEAAHYSCEHSHPVGNEASQLQQNAPVHTLTSVPQTQYYSVQPPVGSVSK